jgi:predicted component of type VI protein secretion system
MAAAQTLCGLGKANGIDCAIVEQPGNHDWPYAARAFATSLPWLAGVIGTPGVTKVPVGYSDIPTNLDQRNNQHPVQAEGR